MWFQRQPNGSWGPTLPEPVLRVPRLAYCACDACLHEARLKACPVRLRPQGRGADVDAYICIAMSLDGTDGTTDRTTPWQRANRDELGARRFYTLKATTQNGLRLHFLGNCVACHGQFDVVVTGPVPRTRALPRYCGNCRFSGGNGDE